MTTTDPPPEVVMVVDVANVMGSRPDGWWRDRAAAASRLLGLLAPLDGIEVTLPAELGAVRITRVRAVVEGAAREVHGPDEVWCFARSETVTPRSSRRRGG